MKTSSLTLGLLGALLASGAALAFTPPTTCNNIFCGPPPPGFVVHHGPCTHNCGSAPNSTVWPAAPAEDTGTHGQELSAGHGTYSDPPTSQPTTVVFTTQPAPGSGCNRFSC